jgi:hypothetical protein
LISTLDEEIGVFGVSTLPTGERGVLLELAVAKAFVAVGASLRWTKVTGQRSKDSSVIDSAIGLLKKEGHWAVVRAMKGAESGPPPPVIRTAADLQPLAGKAQADHFARQFALSHRRRWQENVPGLPDIQPIIKRTAVVQLPPALVKMALESQRDTAGADATGMNPMALKLAAQSVRFVNAFTRLLEDVVRSGEAPHKWKQLVVVAIGKRDKHRRLAESYRAIFVTPWLPRVGETIFGWFDRAALARVPQQLAGTPAPHGLNTRQYGFRQGLGDIIVSLGTASLLVEARSSKLLMLQLCLDFDAAYPSTNENDALVELEKAGASPAGIAFAAAIGGDCLLTAKAGSFRSDPVRVVGGLKAGRKACPTAWAALTSPIINFLVEQLQSVTIGKGKIGYGPRRTEVLVAADDVSIVLLSHFDGIAPAVRILDRCFDDIKQRYGLELSKKSGGVLHNSTAYIKDNAYDSAKVKAFTSCHIGGVDVKVTTEGLVKNLGIFWSGRNDVFGDQAGEMTGLHAKGMSKISAIIDKRPIPILLQLYSAFCVGPWVHSMPVVLGLMGEATLQRLESCHAQGLKRLACISASASNAATVFELGSRSVVCMALGRVAALREQLVRINEQALKVQQNLPGITLALGFLEFSYRLHGMKVPESCSRLPCIWDAPVIRPELLHLANRVVFLGAHLMADSDKETLALEPKSERALAVKVAANRRRMDQLRENWAPVLWGYGDGSVRTIERDAGKERRAGAAANLYAEDDEAPQLQWRRAAPSNACSFTPESNSAAALARMLRSAELPTYCIKGQRVVALIQDSLATIQQLERGPVNVTDAQAAEVWNHLLEALSVRVDLIVFAHVYAHTQTDVRQETVDGDAKRAAEEATCSHVKDALHWWRDDARSAVKTCLDQRAATLLDGSARGKYGSTSPTKWGKEYSRCSVVECRRLAQLRVFCCSGVGGHLHGITHTVTCGLCGRECGRADGVTNPVVHLFECGHLKELRGRSDVKSVQSLWSVNPVAVLHYVGEATRLSREGRHQREKFTLGAHWVSEREETAA